MTKEELLELRKKTFERVKRMVAVGDFGAGALDNQHNAEAVLALIDHLLERMRG
jgi:hypothetical protein